MVTCLIRALPPASYEGKCTYDSGAATLLRDGLEGGLGGGLLGLSRRLGIGGEASERCAEHLWCAHHRRTHHNAARGGDGARWLSPVRARGRGHGANAHLHGWGEPVAER